MVLWVGLFFVVPGRVVRLETEVEQTGQTPSDLDGQKPGVDQSTLEQSAPIGAPALQIVDSPPLQPQAPSAQPEALPATQSHGSGEGTPNVENPTPDQGDELERLKAEIHQHRESLLEAEKARAAAEKKAMETEAQSAQRQAEWEAKEQARRDKARTDLLDAMGLVKPEYGQLAPGLNDADPETDEGRRVYARFRRENEHLFKSSVNLPKAEAVPGIGKKKTMRDIMRGLTT